MLRTHEGTRTRTRDQDPYSVEPALTLAEWRRARDVPFIEVVLRHTGTSSN